MSYTYSYLGNNCESNTIAQTSNKKYINPNNPIYNMVFTRMKQFPGHDIQTNIDENGNSPIDLKAYNSDNADKKVKSCNSCGTN